VRPRAEARAGAHWLSFIRIVFPGEGRI